jgi:hypothetical protein
MTRALTIRRLTGDDVMPVGIGYFFDEPSEDLIIQLLLAKELTAERRCAVIDGCRDVFVCISNQILTFNYSTPSTDATAMRLARVMDATGCAELSPLATIFFSCVLSIENISDDILLAAAIAALSGVKRGDEVQIPWWSAAVHRSAIAAYGFMGLLSIDPYSPRIAQALEELWVRQLINQWPVETPSLAREAARVQGSDAIISHALRALSNRNEQLQSGKSLLQGIAEQLAAKDWSRAWLAFLPENAKEVRN